MTGDSSGFAELSVLRSLVGIIVIREIRLTLCESLRKFRGHGVLSFGRRSLPTPSPYGGCPALEASPDLLSSRHVTWKWIDVIWMTTRRWRKRQSQGKKLPVSIDAEGADPNEPYFVCSTDKLRKFEAPQCLGSTFSYNSFVFNLLTKCKFIKFLMKRERDSPFFRYVIGVTGREEETSLDESATESEQPIGIRWNLYIYGLLFRLPINFPRSDPVAD